MSTRLVDLSMTVRGGMQTFPRVVEPSITLHERWDEFAERVGAAHYGATWLTATCRIEIGDHVGTHIDALKHLREDGPGPDAIPLDRCYGDGVLLDFRAKAYGAGICVSDLQAGLGRIGYALKPSDIVLIWTGAGAYQDEPRYLTDHCGMTAEATNWLIDRGITVMGIDAITFDLPIWAMFDRQLFWEAHRVMLEREYYHVENLTNLDQIGRPFGFKLALFPVKWAEATAAPVRAVAIIEEVDG